MTFQSIQLNNGKVLQGEKIGELVTEIVSLMQGRRQDL